MNSDNPAARLLAILEGGFKYTDNAGCRAVWNDLLNVEAGNDAVLMGRIGKVMSLSSEIKESLNNSGVTKVERYLHWVKPLENAFNSNNLNGPWAPFKTHIDAHVINYLSMTSEILSLKAPEPVMSEGSLNSVLTNARELLDEVRESDMPEKVKAFIIKQLHKVCLAVEEYSINGAASISDAVDAAFGHGVLNGEVVDIAKNNSLVKKFWQYMANTALIVSITVGGYQLAAPIQKLLPEINFTEQVELDHTDLEAKDIIPVEEAVTA